MAKSTISKQILKDLYSKNYSFSQNNQKEANIPKKGNLGLLAYGYIGIIAVRKAQNIKEIQDYIK